MRNRWFAYTAALLATLLFAAAGAYAPTFLMHRSERGILGSVSKKPSGYYSNRSYPEITAIPTPAAPTPTPGPSDTVTLPTPLPDSSLGLALKRVLLIEQANVASIKLSEPNPNDMDMKTAETRCVDWLFKCMKAGAMPAMPNFPGDYTFTAGLYSMAATDGRAIFDYWSISFYTNQKLAKTNCGIGLMMDAETGMIYSFKMYTSVLDDQFNLPAASRFILGQMGISGTMKTVADKKDEPQIVCWYTKYKMVIPFNYQISGDTASFTMNFTTNAYPAAG